MNDKRILVNLHKDIVLVTCVRIFCTTLFTNIIIKVVIQMHAFLMDHFSFLSSFSLLHSIYLIFFFFSDYLSSLFSIFLLLLSLSHLFFLYILLLLYTLCLYLFTCYFLSLSFFLAVFFSLLLQLSLYLSFYLFFPSCKLVKQCLILPGFNFHSGLIVLAGWKKSGIILYPTSYNIFKDWQSSTIASGILVRISTGFGFFIIISVLMMYSITVDV